MPRSVPSRPSFLMSMCRGFLVSSSRTVPGFSFGSLETTLLPWNVNYREDYYDVLLAPGVQRPKTVRMLNALELATYRERNRGGQAAT